MEELSTLERTIISTDSSIQMSGINPSKERPIHDVDQFTPFSAETKVVPLSASITTPQRLFDLHIVSERLALLRKQNTKS